VPDDSSGLYYRLSTTHWSLVCRAGQTDDEARRAALDELLTGYLKPLKAHLVLKRRLSPHMADDVLQEFVARKILHRDLLSSASPIKGRFRTLLLTALDRFVIDQHRAAALRPAELAGNAESDDDESSMLEPEASTDPDVFEVAWARTVLVRALGQMQSQCKLSGRSDVWGVFYHRMLAPLLPRGEELDYNELVCKFNLKSAEQASNVLMTAKRQFARVLAALVSESLSDDEDMNEELSALRNALAAPGAVAVALETLSRHPDDRRSRGTAFDEIESRQLARLLDADESGPTWKQSDFHAMLRHQLNASLTEMLGGLSVSLRTKMALMLTNAHPPIKSLSDLLHHRRPPLGLLKAVRRWTENTRQGSSVPPAMAQAIEALAQASALVQHGHSLAEAPAGQLRVEFARLQGQPWIPHAERSLLARAERALDGRN
jgi:RNA polymerase sigma-70 factor (ECF subfamily)